MSNSDKDISKELAQAFMALNESEELCPCCESDELGYDTQCQEDANGEQIEHFAYCRDCGWSEI